MVKSDQPPPKLLKEKNQHIQVFVRVRPLSQQDKQKPYSNVIECPSSREVSVKEKATSLTSKTFAFDRVFNTQSKQIDVYRTVVNPLIEEVLAGYNCTVFAYGQTGTGKTYTMEGERSADPSITWENDPLCGIIPRTLSHLFDTLKDEGVEFTVRVSFLEIYNEELIDLLSSNDDNTKIRIFEDVTKKGSVILQGLEEITVHDKNDVYQILTKGSMKRQTAATLMNAHSSRSHTVFSITIHIKENLVGGDELLKTGKLNLVDLAGSENIGRSGAVDRRAREAGNINQSLLTLGRVITALVERAPHVPYRESKLTRILQDSLGGRTKTCFIATISPISANLEETLSTLDYAHRAKNITNRPEINQKLTKKELLKEYTEEIERLRRDLLATREKNGIYVDSGEFEKMTVKMTELEEQNAGKMAHIKALKEEMEKMETLCNDLHMQIEEKTTALMQKTEMLVETEGRLKNTQTALVKTFREKELNQHLVDYHSEKEKKLGEQAKTLLKVADQTTDDVSRLHDKLSRKRSVEEGNKGRSAQFKENFHRNFGRMDDWLEKLLTDHTSFCTNLRSTLGEQQDHKISELTAMSEHLTSQVQMFTTMLHDMERQSAEAMRQAQYWVHSHLEGVRATTGASSEALRNSLMDLILPPMEGIMMQLQKSQTNLQEMSIKVNDLIREKEHQAEVHAAETMNAINSLEESVSQYVHVQKQEVEWLKTASSNYFEDSQTETKEMEVQIDAMKEMLDRMSGMLETKQQRANITASELGEGMTRSETACDKFDSEMKKISESLKKEQTKSAESHKQSAEKLLQIFNDFTIKSNLAIGSAQNLREEAVSSCWSAVNSNEDAWREQYQGAEEELRDHAEMLKKYLQSEQEQNQKLSNKVRETAEVQESLLESQRNSFKSFVQQRQDELEAECSSVRDHVKVISDELRKREIELNHFFTNELVEDRPTGETPPRRETVYPRRLVASSPRERVIQRVLAQMDEAPSISLILSNTDKKEEDVEKLSSSTRSLPESVDHLPVEFEQDTSNLQKAISDTNVSNVVVNTDSVNQVENGENQDPVEVEQKTAIPTAKGQRRTLRYRKPLLSKNSE